MLSNLHNEPSDLAEKRICDCEAGPLFYAGVEYTPPARGTWSIAHTPMLVPESHEIFFCPDGCLRGVVLSAAEGGFQERFSMISFEEEDLYNGEVENLLIKGILKIVSELPKRPKCIFVFTSCIHELMGFDYPHVFEKLRAELADIDVIESYMNCTMRKSKLNFEDVQWRQNYAALHLAEKNLKQINIIGNPFELDRQSELVQLLEKAGYEVLDVCRISNYDEYQKMAASSLNIYNLPLAKEAARSLEEKLGQESIYLPFTWDYEKIDSGLQVLFSKLKIDSETCTQNLTRELVELRKKAETELSELADLLNENHAEIQLDAVGIPRAFELAALLEKHGIPVSKIYAEAVSEEEDEAFEYLKENAPNIFVSSMVNFRLRTRPRGSQNKVVAIGQRSAYFSNTRSFVNVVTNDGMYGYTAIIKLADSIKDALQNEKDTEKLISIKAKSCEERMTK